MDTRRVEQAGFRNPFFPALCASVRGTRRLNFRSGRWYRPGQSWARRSAPKPVESWRSEGGRPRFPPGYLRALIAGGGELWPAMGCSTNGQVRGRTYESSLWTTTPNRRGHSCSLEEIGEPIYRFCHLDRCSGAASRTPVTSGFSEFLSRGTPTLGWQDWANESPTAGRRYPTICSNFNGSGRTGVGGGSISRSCW